MVDGNIKDEIQDKLSLIADPHMGISIVEMGLVRDITVVEASYDWIGYVFSISLGQIPKGEVNITSCKPFVYFRNNVCDLDWE